MKKNKNVDENLVMARALDFSRSFTLFGETPDKRTLDRMLLISRATYEGWGAKIVLPNGSVIPYSTIKAYVEKCGNHPDRLSHMDETIRKFTSKFCDNTLDMFILSDICYDVNTLF
ncbi:MAG: hypothetical protein HGA25_10785 [Clostridiales bacterium]|nr:hypothetical protein [Clostridiales bacterium]